jgi:D-glycero-D-manno-heptose 1,7-bisphosphate phosphatase
MPDPRVFDRYGLFIFDADETLRQTVIPGKPCPHGPDEWVLMPGVKDVLSEVRWNAPGSPRMGIASNQDQVAYGHLTVTTARELLRDLARSATGSVPDDGALQLCPHSLELDCECRKPKPGMLIAIMRHYGVDPGRTMFVGNHEIDHEAAARAGTAFTWSHDFFAQLE